MAWAAVLPAVVWTLVAFVLPFSIVAAASLRARGPDGAAARWGFENYQAFWARPALVEAAINSVEIGLIVTVLSLALAYPMAALLAFQVPPRWQRLALVLAVLPFWTSYVVRAYAWSLVLARTGILNRGLDGLGLPILDVAASRAATVVGFVHFFTMLMTLTIFAALVRLPRGLTLAAADLGAGPWARFRHVIVPLSLPGVAVGAFLTFVLTLGDYVTPQVLGGGSELTLPEAIMLEIGRRADLPMAATLAIVLMGLIGVAWALAARPMAGARF
ncbi:MAG: ABC transporter permease [Pseudomonadota bacterium]